MKALRWAGRSKAELDILPAEVKDVFGYAFWVAQVGGKHRDAKLLQGFGGAGVLEVVADFDGGTYRGVYTVRLADAVYVLHCFQKKSRRGIRTDPATLALVRQRLREAEVDHERRRARIRDSG